MSLSMSRAEREEFLAAVHVGKSRAIRAAGRFSLCARDEQPSYRYVTVEGPAVANPGVGQVAIRMTAEHRASADFGQA